MHFEWIYPIVLILFVIVVVWMMSLLNRLKTLRNEASGNWNEMNKQLKRRHHLVADLLEMGSPVLTYEQPLIKKVSQARENAEKNRVALSDSNGIASEKTGLVKEMMFSEKNLNTAVSEFIITFESYPIAAKEEKVEQINEELRATENRLSQLRRGYNDSVDNYNGTQLRFPNYPLSKILGHEQIDSFKGLE